MLNNERFFAQKRDEILKGNIDTIKTELTDYVNEFKNINQEAAKEIGISFQEVLNLIDQVNSATGSMGKKGNSQKQSAWEQYLENKRTYYDAGSDKARKHAENERLRSQFGFEDGSYKDLKNKAPSFHSGGWVSNAMKGLQSNEIFAKLLKNEFVLTEAMIGNLNTTLSRLLNMNAISMAGSGSVTNTYHLDFKFDNFRGTQKEGKTITDKVSTELKKLGK